MNEILNMVDKLPQRFRWRDKGQSHWRWGVVMPGALMWHISAGFGHGSFDDDPWDMMGKIIGDVDEFQWLDNDYGWSGDRMPY